MAVAKIANRLGRYGRSNPGRRHLAGADVTSTMQRQYEHILDSLRASRRYRSDAKRKQVAAATVRKLAAQQNPNSDSAVEAEQLAEEFHGRPVRDVIDVVEHESYDTQGAVLGYLVELSVFSEDWEGAYAIQWPYDLDDPESNIHVVSNPKGTHIDFVGGDQSFDWWNVPGASGDEHKYYVYVGPLYEIVYFADKHHLSGPKRQKSGMEYFHEWEEIPYLVFDQRNVKLLLVGGKYTIEPEGITG